MFKQTNLLIRVFLCVVILFTGLASTTGTAYGDSGDLVITRAEVTMGEECGEISFYFEWENGTGSELYFMDYGNGDTTPLGEVAEISESSISIEYTYLAQGDIQWTFQIGDVSISDTLTIGPKVTLNSSPFPPLFVVGDEGEVDFSNQFPAAHFRIHMPGIWMEMEFLKMVKLEILQHMTYTEVGKIYPQVMVTDGCSLLRFRHNASCSCGSRRCLPSYGPENL